MTENYESGVALSIPCRIALSSSYERRLALNKLFEGSYYEGEDDHYLTRPDATRFPEEGEKLRSLWEKWGVPGTVVGAFSGGLVVVAGSSIHVVHPNAVEILP